MSSYGAGLVIVLLCFGAAGGIVGRIKGSSFIMWFLISASVPFIGLLTAVFYRYENHELRRQCPRCRQLIMLYDAVCMHCGEELEFPEVAVASAARTADRRRTPAH